MLGVSTPEGTSTRPRVERGVPTGGQFAAYSHDEAGLDLDPDFNEPSGRVVYEQTLASGRYWGPRYGVDPEDVAQETALRWFAALRRREEMLAASSDAEPAVLGESTNPGGYIHRMARNVAVSMMSNVSSNDRHALGVLSRARTAKEMELGRELTRSENMELAAEVAQSLPKDRRPTANYWDTGSRTVISLDAQESYARDGMLEQGADRAASSAAHGGEFAEGTAGHEAEEALGNGAAGRARARSLSWDAVADSFGGPKVARQSMSDNAAMNHRRVVRASGGIDEVARRWAQGAATDEETAALFAPFGSDLSNDQKWDVIDCIDKSGSYGQDVWNAAVGSATNVYARKPKSSKPQAG